VSEELVQGIGGARLLSDAQGPIDVDGRVAHTAGQTFEIAERRLGRVCLADGVLRTGRRTDELPPRSLQRPPAMIRHRSGPQPSHAGSRGCKRKPIDLHGQLHALAPPTSAQPERTNNNGTGNDRRQYPCGNEHSHNVTQKLTHRASRLASRSSNAGRQAIAQERVVIGGIMSLASVTPLDVRQPRSEREALSRIWCCAFLDVSACPEAGVAGAEAMMAPSLWRESFRDRDCT
jgi:hypothetical protein